MRGVASCVHMARRSLARLDVCHAAKPQRTPVFLDRNDAHFVLARSAHSSQPASRLNRVFPFGKSRLSDGSNVFLARSQKAWWVLRDGGFFIRRNGLEGLCCAIKVPALGRKKYQGLGIKLKQINRQHALAPSNGNSGFNARIFRLPNAARKLIPNSSLSVLPTPPDVCAARCFPPPASGSSPGLQPAPHRRHRL
jgi:hypothetical protein